MSPVRSVLYNLTFDVIVSADVAGTVCVWNIATGAREGRFMKAHGEAKLTAMCFDKNERRLVTAGGDGSVFMWNFNNGSKLREYAHAEDQQELVSVIFLADEKRESDAVYAAGWNAKVFVWEEDDDADVVTEYRSYEGHREDITSMAAYAKRTVLATGDYEGRITIWNPFTGEKRMCLFHRAERYETTVECMLWVPLRSARKKGIRSMSSSLARSNVSAAASTVAAGVTSHAGIVLNTDDPVLNECSPLSNSRPMLLLSSGGDGLIRVWLVGSVGKLVCSLQGAQGRLEQVSCIAADRAFNHIVVGDTAGHIRVWDISNGIDTSSLEACRSSFKERSHWRGHQAPINAVDLVPERDLVIVACKDQNVTIWNLDGGLLGTLGEDIWVLDDPRTWKDFEGQYKEVPMAETDNLYLQVRDEDVDKDADNDDENSRDNDGNVREMRGLDMTSAQIATALLSDRKARQKELATVRPMGLHSQLRVSQGLLPDLDSIGH